MTLDILTATQGGTWAIVHTECCVYIADIKENGSQALSALAGKIDGIQRLTGDTCKNGGLNFPPHRDGPCPVRRRGLSPGGLLLFFVLLLWPLGAGLCPVSKEVCSEGPSQRRQTGQ